MWIGALFVAVVSLLAADSELKLQEDSGIYIALAESLADGYGYRSVFLVDAPPHAQYPPVFPVLLLPAVFALGADFRAMKLLMTPLAVAALPVVHALFRARADARTAALVVLLTATSPAVVYFTQSIMTEIPYLLLSLVAVLWIERSARRTGWSASAVVVAALLLSLVCLTRVVGISLLLAAVLYVALEGAERRLIQLRTALAIAALAAVPLALWFAYSSSASLDAGSPYLRYYSWSLNKAAAPSWRDGAVVLLFKLRAALYAYGVHLGHATVYWLPSPPIGSAIALLLAGVGVAGFFRCAMRQRTVAEYYVFLYVCALLVFPGSRQQRYVVPLIPFWWFYVVSMTDAAARWLSRRREPTGPAGRATAVVGAAMLGLALLNAVTSVVVNVVRHGRGYYEPVARDPFRDALEWVRRETPPHSVLLWAKPGLGYILAGRRAVPVRARTPPAALLALVRDRHVEYVVVHPTWKVAEALKRLVAAYPDRLALVHQEGGVRIYRVVDGGA